MPGTFVVLTGASGAGKTTIALGVEKSRPEYIVFRFDTIGVPSAEVMATFGNPDQNPGEAWQRAMTLQWFARIAPLLKSGAHVLFEGQMRIAFIDEALKVNGITNARVLLVDCSNEIRAKRLTDDRLQPALANKDMMNWGEYLRQEALEAGYEVFNTGNCAIAESVQRVIDYLGKS